jgi:hypothetical protein
MTGGSDHDEGTSCGPTFHCWPSAAERLALWHELTVRQAIRIDAGLPPLDLNHEFDRAVTRIATMRYRECLAPFVTNALLSQPPTSGMLGTMKRYRTAHAVAVKALSQATGFTGP